MTAGSGLDALRDVQLPDPVGWWPPAPGWWVLLAVAISAGIALALWARASRRPASPARDAHALLERIAQRFEETGDAVELATQLSRLLRRVSLTRSERREVAGLYGVARQRALAREAGATPIPHALIERLESVVYAGAAAPIEDHEPLEWIAAAGEFIRRLP